MQRYDRQFYDDLTDTALPSARRIVPLLQEMMPVDSVVDLGCGNGAWLSVFRERGASRILGIEGDWIDETQLLIPTDCFRRARLEAPFEVEGTFDLSMSLEVAEHLPPDRADGFVDTLCGLAPVVLFSAAIPFQGGQNHFNEQWPDYWAELFARRGYRPVDTLRLAVWEDREVEWWYKQNLLIFANDAALAAHPKLAAAQRATALPLLRLVHTDRYLIMARDLRPSLGKWLRRGPKALRRSLAKRRAK